MNTVKNKIIQELNNVILDIDEENISEKKDEKDHLKKIIEQHLNGAKTADKKRLLKLYKSGAPLTGPNGIRKRLGAIDLEFFGKAYLTHYFSRSSPKFHRDLNDLWTENVLKNINPLKKSKEINKQKGKKCAVAAPRGHAKSTNLTFKDPLHAILYRYKNYIILMSDTFGQACGFLDSIKSELEENLALIEDFGELKGTVWRDGVILTKSKIKIQAMGAGQKVRGLKHKNWRPDLFVIDDCENDELIRTADQRNKLHNWYTKAVSKAGDSYTDFFFIGTILHYDSLLSKVLKKPAYKCVKYKAVIDFSNSGLWDTWEKMYTDLDDDEHEAHALEFFNEHKKEMLLGTKVLWEEKNSYYDLMCDKVNDGDAAFNSELQNEPINPEDCTFNEEWMDFYNPFDIDFSDRRFRFYGAVDPSLGKSKNSDYSAIITLALDIKTGYVYVLDADIERRHPDKIIEDVIEKAKWIFKTYKKKYVSFGAETNQFQWFLKESLAKESARQHVYLPIVEVNQSSDKIMRIQTLQPLVKNKYIKFNKQHKKLTEQLNQFPMGDHDDGPDALQMAVSIATKKIGGSMIRVRRRSA